MEKIDINKQNKYGRLTIVRELEQVLYGKNKIRRVLCKCDCGNMVKITLNHLRTGNVVSCGCYRLEKQTKHNLKKHPLYSVWKGMKKRCNNKKEKCYLSYGGRGIKVCEIWETNFKNFYDWAIKNGYEKGLEIDRINNNGNYEPQNCHFTTHKENCQNRRLRTKKIRLYFHRTSGGAEYLTDTFIKCKDGSKEGTFEGAKYIIRIDGDITKDAELNIRG